jgi:hypothetical protein
MQMAPKKSPPESPKKQKRTKRVDVVELEKASRTMIERDAAIGFRNTQEIKLELPQPHPKQYELIFAFELNPGVRFVAGACGTKFGKTYGCSIRIVKEAWENERSLNWWVAPTYDQSGIAMSLVKRLIPDGMYIEYKADRTIVLLNPDGSERSRIVFKSGDNPDNLRGHGVNFFIIDEAARIPYESFVSVMTTVTKTRGRGIVISTPKGRGWFHTVYQRGEKYTRDGRKKYSPHLKGCTLDREADIMCDCPNADPWDEWMAIRMPTSANPTVPKISLIEAKKNLPEDVYEQEYLAEFNEDSAGVFKGIKECLRGDFEPYNPLLSYVIGVDLARLRDYTVLTVMDRQRKHVVALHRFNQIRWEIQYDRIRALAAEYHALCVIDSTGIGDPIVETLRSGGIPVEPYKIGGTIAKQQLIEKLRVNIEKGKISFPEIPELLRELEAYEYKISDTGQVRYESPDNEHDDTVISLALANWVADTEPYIYKFFHRRGV